MTQLQIKLVRSLIGRTEVQRATVQSLGLRKLNQTVTREDSPGLRGMLDKVAHMVQVSEINA
ncbi:MAG: 50S ribosomal protein L30 [Bacilli bacterium]